MVLSEEKLHWHTPKVFDKSQLVVGTDSHLFDDKETETSSSGCTVPWSLRSSSSEVKARCQGTKFDRCPDELLGRWEYDIVGSKHGPCILQGFCRQATRAVHISKLPPKRFMLPSRIGNPL